MTTLDYRPGPFNEDDYEPAPSTAQRPTAGSEKLDSPSTKDPDENLRDLSRDNVDNPLQDPLLDHRANEALTNLFPDKDVPNPKELHDRLESAWTAYQAATGPQAHTPEAARDFKLAAVYSLTNTSVTDPAGDGPLAYAPNAANGYMERGNPTADHTETSHLRFLQRTIDDAHDWDPRTEAGADRGVHHITRIQDRLEANERHIADFTELSLTNPPAEDDAVFWGRTTEENTEALRNMTDNFNDTSSLDALLTFQQGSLSEADQALQNMNGPARGDEVGMLYQTAASAAEEYTLDRDRLEQTLADIFDAHPTQHTTFLQEQAAELLAHMNFTHGLTDHTTLQAQLEVEDMLERAHDQNSGPTRLSSIIIAHRGH